MNKIEHSDDKGANQPGSKSFRVIEKNSSPSYSALFPWLIRPQQGEHTGPGFHHHDQHRDPEPRHHGVHPRPCQHHRDECHGMEPHHHHEHPGRLDPHYRNERTEIDLNISDSYREQSIYLRILMGKRK
jgi:hypothetical protein